MFEFNFPAVTGLVTGIIAAVAGIIIIIFPTILNYLIGILMIIVHHLRHYSDDISEDSKLSSGGLFNSFRYLVSGYRLNNRRDYHTCHRCDCLDFPQDFELYFWSLFTDYWGYCYR
jgi:hypothetical protein